MEYIRNDEIYKGKRRVSSDITSAPPALNVRAGWISDAGVCM